VPAVHGWFNDAATTAMLLEQRDEFNEADAHAWVERAIAASGEDRKWAIAIPDLDRAAGFTAVYGIGGQLAPEVGLLVDGSLRSGGVGSEALRQTLERAFDEHAAHRVYARILAKNEASKRLFEGLGFRREGLLRNHVKRGGELIDVELWGLLRDELAYPKPT
jgi:RimJ/RimL family protein N-acetyltransferase